MPLPITNRTIIATYHHTRQSDLDPTVEELRAWHTILQSNYEEVLPSEMLRNGLSPSNADHVDLALLLGELTEASGVIARASRGCKVVAGLLRTGAIVDGATPRAATRPASVGDSRGRRRSLTDVAPAPAGRRSTAVKRARSAKKRRARKAPKPA